MKDHLNFLLVFQQYIKHHFQVHDFYEKIIRFDIHLVIKLPNGVDINNLIDDLRIFSWEASEILLHYSQILKDSNYKSNILKK